MLAGRVKLLYLPYTVWLNGPLQTHKTNLVGNREVYMTLNVFVCAGVMHQVGQLVKLVRLRVYIILALVFYAVC